MTGEQRSQFPIEEAVTLYSNGRSLEQVAVALGYDRITVRTHLLRANVTLRGRGGNTRAYSLKPQTTIQTANTEQGAHGTPTQRE